MKVAIIGYGNMGKEIEQVCIARGHNVAAIIDPRESKASAKALSAGALKGVDVAIDFSAASAAFDNASVLAKAGVPFVVGTTGIDDMESIRKLVSKYKTGAVYGSNFSIGVAVYSRIVERASQLFDKVAEYDAFGYELHHNKKADSPSGTAKNLAQVITKNLSRKKIAVFEALNRKIAPDELHFASVRGGSIPGTHVVGFDSPADTIELVHRARNRSGFASGAVMAAQWVRGKKGFFTFDDCLKDTWK